jgi:alpha-N-acetylglucosamine transferase
MVVQVKMNLITLLLYCKIINIRYNRSKLIVVDLEQTKTTKSRG